MLCGGCDSGVEIVFEPLLDRYGGIGVLARSGRSGRCSSTFCSAAKTADQSDSPSSACTKYGFQTAVGPDVLHVLQVDDAEPFGAELEGHRGMVAGECVVRRVPDQLELLGQPVEQLQYAERRRHEPPVMRLHPDLHAVPLGRATAASSSSPRLRRTDAAYPSGPSSAMIRIIGTPASAQAANTRSDRSLATLIGSTPSARNCAVNFGNSASAVAGVT